MAAAKAAALAAETASLFDDEPEVAAKAAPAAAAKDQTDMRMEKFESQMKDVVKKQKTTEELDVRGVRLQTQEAAAPESKNSLDDTGIQAVLRGEKTKSKKKKTDMLKTETGEELYMAEFAPGADVSPFALPDDKELDFDPLNPPLPSELAAKQSAQEDPMSMPLVSELDSPTQQTLYSQSPIPIEDDALFKIKSVFDETEQAPGRVVDKPGRKSPRRPQEEEEVVPMSASATPSLEEMIARDRAAIKSSVNEGRPLIEVDAAANALDEVGESASFVVRRALGLLLAADFFVVIFFLGWLGVAIVYQYAACGGLTREGGPVCDNGLYNSWYALWTPVIQPALGILMAGNILQGTLNGLAGNKDEE